MYSKQGCPRPAVEYRRGKCVKFKEKYWQQGGWEAIIKVGACSRIGILYTAVDARKRIFKS